MDNEFIDTAGSPLPSGSVTFLMTDIAGSTRLWESRADSMREAIRKHDGIVQSAVEHNAGRLIKERGEGDSHFCVFTSPQDAVRAAIQIQQELPHQEWGVGAPILVRMSIHSANAEPHGGDYYGRDVNRCARIRAAAHGGQILVSDVARDGSSGFDFLDLGLHRLMDLSEPQRIYQVLAPDIARDFPHLRSLNAIRHNLPVQLTSFVGREKELEALRNLKPRPRLVSILGPGGAGKTRIALQLAAESIDNVTGGVWFVDLSSIQDAAVLQQKVIEDLYIKVGVDDPDEAIAAHFRGEPMLLVLDNCEHVAREAATFVGKLLKSSPNVTVIATSREPLNVAGEQTYRLPPMDVKTERAESLDDIAHLDSVSLLLERARARGFEEVLRNTKPQTVLDLCRKLDGIPLALEQAAANLGVLTPEAMLARLDEQLSVLHIDDEGVEARHRTLSAAIDWSYDTLTDEERNLFLDLAIFVGGWTLEAAESICVAPNVLTTMQRLVAKSLVWPEATAHGDRRFRFLETMREYAVEKRRELPEEVKQRHLAYYSHLAKLAEAAGLDVDDGKWKKVLDSDHSNVIGAFHRALETEDDAEVALDLAISMFSYWLQKDYYRQASTWFQAALEASPNAPLELRANALNRLGIFATYLRKLGPAKTALEASLQLWRAVDNVPKMGAVLSNLAWIALEEDNATEARRLFEQSVELFTKAKNDLYLAQGLQNLAQLDANEGQTTQAIELWNRAIAILRTSKENFSLLAALANLLGCYAESSGLTSHLDSVEEVIVLAQSLGNAELAASVLDLVAFAALENSKANIAARYLGTATSLEAQSGVELTNQTRPFRERLAARIKEALGRQAYKRELAAGANVPMANALDDARQFISSL